MTTASNHNKHKLKIPPLPQNAAETINLGYMQQLLLLMLREISQSYEFHISSICAIKQLQYTYMGTDWFGYVGNIYINKYLKAFFKFCQTKLRNSHSSNQ